MEHVRSPSVVYLTECTSLIHTIPSPSQPGEIPALLGHAERMLSSAQSAPPMQSLRTTRLSRRLNKPNARPALTFTVPGGIRMKTPLRFIGRTRLDRSASPMRNRPSLFAGD